MSDFAVLVQAVAALLWPPFAFVFMLIFRKEVSEAPGQIKRIRKGKFLGQEIEFDEMLERDETSRLISDYLLPGGVYSDNRARFTVSARWYRQQADAISTYSVCPQQGREY